MPRARLDSLSDFLALLESEGELLRVHAPISPLLEISHLADRHARLPAPTASDTARRFDPDHAESGGRALLLEQVEGSDLPVAINVLGSYRRMELAMGVAASGGFEAIADRLAELLRPTPPGSLRDAIAMLRRIAPLARIGPRTVRRGPCQEIVQLTERGEVDLCRLPLLQCWPLDGALASVGWPDDQDEGSLAGEGRYVTFAGMHTIHADDDGATRPASHNVGLYRAQLVDATHLVMHWHVHHDGAAHWRSWKRAGRPMPIAIAFGGEPILPWAATAPLPPGMNELLMAGFVRGRGIPMVRCATVPLRVPANSELVIEGFVRTDAGEIDWVPDGAEPLGPGAAIEGPFGDHTGWYSMPDRYPLVEVTAITRRRDAIFPATVVGPPPQEDYYMGKAVERIFLPLLQLLMPDLVDYHLPMFGAFHNVAIVGIRKAWPLQARRIMHAIWGAGQMSWTKVLIVVDETVDVHDQGAVLAALCARCHPVRDVETVRGPLDILDHASPALGAGGKIGFDATRRLPGEDACGVPWDLPVARPDPAAVRAEAEALTGTHRITATAVPERGSGRLLLLAVDKAAAGQGAAAIEAAFHRVPGAGLVLAVDTSVDVAALETALFHVMANMDPSRDLLRREDRLGIDATPKRPGDERHGGSVRPWPPVMALDETVLRRLAGRAEELGLA